jgi:hypothetical protein
MKLVDEVISFMYLVDEIISFTKQVLEAHGFKTVFPFLGTNSSAFYRSWWKQEKE